jgi:Recombinase
MTGLTVVPTACGPITGCYVSLPLGLPANARFLLTLIESGGDAAFCDLPSVPPGAARPGAYWLTGGANPTTARRAGEVARANAVAAYADLAPMLSEMKAEGMSLRQIAGRLNAEGHTTRRGKPWNQVQVGRVLGGTPTLVR